MPTVSYMIIDALYKSKNIVDDDLETLFALDVAIDLADGMLKTSLERLPNLIEVLQSNAKNAESVAERAGYTRAVNIVRETTNVF